MNASSAARPAGPPGSFDPRSLWLKDVDEIMDEIAPRGVVAVLRGTDKTEVEADLAFQLGRSADAINFGGSPGLRAVSRTVKPRPVTRRAVSMTSRTEHP